MISKLDIVSIIRGSNIESIIVGMVMVIDNISEEFELFVIGLNRLCIDSLSPQFPIINESNKNITIRNRNV